MRWAKRWIARVVMVTKVVRLPCCDGFSASNPTAIVGPLFFLHPLQPGRAMHHDQGMVSIFSIASDVSHLLVRE